MIGWINLWRANRLLAKAQAAMHAQEWDAARQASLRAYELRPGGTDALTVAGLACFRLSDYQQAVACYEEILAVKPGDFLTRRNMAMALSRLKQWPKAHELFRELSAERPSDPDIRDAVAFVAAKLGDAAGPGPASEESVKQAIAAHNWPRVIALAQGALQKRSDDADAMLQLGMALYHSNQLQNAKEWFGKAVEATRAGLTTRHAAALHNLATACMKLGEWEPASESLQTVLAMIRSNDPGAAKLKRANVLINLIVCYREMHRHSLAKAAYTKLLEIDPAAAAKIDPSQLEPQLGARLRSSALLGAKLELAEEAHVPEAPQPSSGQECPDCGTEAPAGSRFCGNCGARLPQAEVATA
jgi:tetratricopeptide (TPR) repeat protein